MKQVNGCWVPDGDAHYVEILRSAELEHGFPAYQADKRRAAMGFVKARRVAFDVGAHVGLWSRPLSLAFDRLIAFEPDAARAECWGRNMEAHGGDLWLQALDDVVRLDQHPDPGALDFLKVDTEGTELRVLQGAEGALRLFKPVVCVEQKPKNVAEHGLPERGAIDFLVSLGAAVRWEKSGVYVLSWEEN